MKTDYVQSYDGVTIIKLYWLQKRYGISKMSSCSDLTKSTVQWKCHVVLIWGRVWQNKHVMVTVWPRAWWSKYVKPTNLTKNKNIKLREWWRWDKRPERNVLLRSSLSQVSVLATTSSSQIIPFSLSMMFNDWTKMYGWTMIGPNVRLNKHVQFPWFDQQPGRTKQSFDKERSGTKMSHELIKMLKSGSQLRTWYTKRFIHEWTNCSCILSCAENMTPARWTTHTMYCKAAYFIRPCQMQKTTKPKPPSLWSDQSKKWLLEIGGWQMVFAHNYYWSRPMQAFSANQQSKARHSTHSLLSGRELQNQKLNLNPLAFVFVLKKKERET